MKYHNWLQLRPKKVECPAYCDTRRHAVLPDSIGKDLTQEDPSDRPNTYAVENLENIYHRNLYQSETVFWDVNKAFSHHCSASTADVVACSLRRRVDRKESSQDIQANAHATRSMSARLVVIEIAGKLLQCSSHEQSPSTKILHGSKEKQDDGTKLNQENNTASKNRR